MAPTAGVAAGVNDATGVLQTCTVICNFEIRNLGILHQIIWSTGMIENGTTGFIFN